MRDACIGSRNGARSKVAMVLHMSVTNDVFLSTAKWRSKFTSRLCSYVVAEIHSKTKVKSAKTVAWRWF